MGWKRRRLAQANMVSNIFIFTLSNINIQENFLPSSPVSLVPEENTIMCPKRPKIGWIYQKLTSYRLSNVTPADTLEDCEIVSRWVDEVRNIGFVMTGKCVTSTSGFRKQHFEILYWGNSQLTARWLTWGSLKLSVKWAGNTELRNPN